MTSTLVTARHVLVHQGDGHRMLRDGAVLVRGARIEWVGPAEDAPAAGQRIELGESLLMPGLIDLEGLADIDHIVLDSWIDGDTALLWSRDYAPRAVNALGAEDRSRMRLYAVAQLALHGITSFMPIASEVHTAWSETHDDAMDLVAAARAVGLRGFIGPSYRSAVHVAEPDGSMGMFHDEAAGRRGFADALRFLDTVRELGDPLVTGVLAPCRVESVSRELLERTARVAAEQNALVRVHVFQDLFENEMLAASHGTDAMGLLRETGLLNDRLVIAHGVYLDRHPQAIGEDTGQLAELAAAGVSIVHCPVTNARYSFHLHRLGDYLEAGVNMALGSDSFPPDLIRAMDLGTHLAKAQYGSLESHFLPEYVNAATLGGARALHRDDLGRIAAGASADLAAFALDSVRTGPMEDPLRTLLQSGTGANAVFSMVAGRPVVQDGKLPGVDLEALREDGQRIFDRLKASYSERTASTAGELFPPVFPEAGPFESRVDPVEEMLRN
ncbi:chlorohydrolase family protein [Paeniglutamicibacter sp. NPDC091659]|uniref:chlorohydrolase family protein n=1 Tax=Paeniglutamicibacter sp. NPDC091659 TaxID=3364389 RepID=UPI003823D670